MRRIHLTRAFLTVSFLHGVLAQSPAFAQVTATPQRPWAIQSDHWYALSIASRPVGWMRIVRENDGQRYRTANQMSLNFQEAGANAQIEWFDVWLETHAGEPVRFEQFSLSGAGDAGSAWEKLRNDDASGDLTLKRAWEFEGETTIMTVPRGTVMKIGRAHV